MKKVGIVLSVLLLLVAAAAAAVPWYLGMEAEKEIRARLKDPGGSNSPFMFTLVQYERGWLHSSALHRVSLKADSNVYFDVRHEVEHLPDPRFGLVQVTSTPRWPQAVQAAADYYFAKQPAVTVTTTMDFERQLRVRIDSPAFSKPLLTQPEVKLTWGGAAGSVHFGSGSTVQFDVKMPRLAFEGGGAVADLSAASLHGDWTMAASQLDWQGETRFTVDKVTFKSPGGGGSLSGLEAAVRQQNQGQTLLLGYLLKVKEGVATGAGVEQQGFTDAVMDLELDHLNKQALAKYFDDLAGAQESGVSSEAQVRLTAQLWLGMMSELLKDSPELRIKQFGLKTANGTLNASAVLGFDGNGFTQAASPAELLTRTKFAGNAQVSGALLRAWLTKDARAQAMNVLLRQGGNPDEAQVQLLSEQLIQQQLTALETSGLLKAEGEGFALRAEMAGGKLMVNGAPADQLLGPMFAPRPAAPQIVPEQHA